MYPVDKAYKDIVCQKICIHLGHAIREKKLKDKELCEVCNFVLVAIESIDTHEKLVDFLGTLSARWPVFSPVYIHEKEAVHAVTQTASI